MSGAARRKAIEPEAPTAYSLESVTGFRLRRLQGLFVAHWSEWFRDLAPPVTPVQGGIILLIDENPGLTQADLARLLRIEPPTVIQSLAPLIRSGLVKRYRLPNDGRAFALHLSRQGQTVKEAINAGLEAREQALMKSLSSDEQRTFSLLLDKLLAGAESELDRSRGR